MPAIDEEATCAYLSQGSVLIAVSQETLQGPNRKDPVRTPSYMGIASEPGR
jgi:hypothetical protein